jgi:hypothetical protein
MNDPIRGLKVISGDNTTIDPGKNWTKIGADLNSNSRGKYLYLCYAKDKAEFGDPIVDIIVRIAKNRNDMKFPKDYTVIDQDCNEGTKVHELAVYIAYLKDPGATTAAIKDIKVLFNHEPLPDKDWFLVEGDLNAGARGDWIQIAYKR